MEERAAYYTLCVCRPLVKFIWVLSRELDGDAALGRAGELSRVENFQVESILGGLLA